MTEFDDEDQEVFEDASLPLAAMKRVFESIRTVLERMLLAAPNIDEKTPQAIIKKLSELQSAHQQIVAAQEAFHAEHGQTGKSSDVDLSTIRADVGGQLDRLRAAIVADGVSVETDS